MDPPYNSRQYCDAYHLYENLVRWEKPEVKGVAGKFNQKDKKSDFCTMKAVDAFADLVDNLHTRYIVLSYNNMAKKGNGRSNAKMDDTDIMRILEAKGRVQVFPMTTDHLPRESRILKTIKNAYLYVYATITRLSEPDTITSQLYRWKIQAITANPALVSRKHRCVGRPVLRWR